MGQGFDGARVVTMKGLDVDRLQEHAPELEVFLAAVHPQCDLIQVEQTWDAFADGRAQQSTAASFRVAEGRLDLAGALAFTGKALQKAKLRRLPRDAEKMRDVFALDEGCVRCAPARILFGAGIVEVIRVDRLDPCPASSVATAIPTTIVDAARVQLLGAPSRFRRTVDLEPGGYAPPRIVEAAVFAGPEGPVRLALENGVVTAG